MGGPMKEALLYEKLADQRVRCTLCAHRNPVEYDELVAELVEEQHDLDRYPDIREIEAMAPGEKWTFFENLLSPCIRCYACRNACPLCYCPTCFVDESKPQWVGKSVDPIDTMTFHFLRAYHCAGSLFDRAQMFYNWLAEDERAEARWVADRAEELAGDTALGAMAVLMRTNAQTRPFEEELTRRQLPYRVVGGLRFWQRAEIKDALA